MGDTDTLYQAIGLKIREAREGVGGKLSQEKLAKRLGVSRASIVNIEAGRQHAPLHLLWQIAETLGTDLVLLIPRRDELAVTDLPVRLDDKMLRQIERAAEGDPDTQRRVAGFISKLKISMETTKTKDTHD